MLDNVFPIYQSIYRNIFWNMYPAKDRSGFSSRNLAINFSKAYETVAGENHERACSWFDFQFGEKNNLSVDAVLLNTDSRQLVIVETKHFNSPGATLRSISKDINRFYELVSELEEEDRIDMNIMRHIYGVILADVWDESRAKRKLLEAYQDGSVLDLYSGAMENEYYPEGAECHAQRASEMLKYYLLSLVWEI